MKISRYIFYILATACFCLIVGSQFGNFASAKTVTVHYVSTTGKVLKSPKKITLPAGGLTIFNPAEATHSQYIKGYVPYDGTKTFSFNNCPSSLKVRYSKISTVQKKVAKYYMSQINSYRVKQGLSKLKHNASLQKQATVRANELWIKTSHTRPDGTSYNSYNSGYAEVMAVFPSCFSYVQSLGAKIVYNSKGTIDYKKTAKTASNELLTIDAQHRDTELNTWSKYSDVAFSFKPDGSGMMAQLFKL
ncbi:CAP domain-containing protein [Lentilactobacillus sp. Marseille-Q4993]|uniref:CAP domain-containing protein n=1 Tax=Lentilactobacillus sp. Marseille-Q4993 TaxID=3039492 RepID=UPI0024BCC34D|nr:CAP domain-containing protein [Lentilactobacillus sp. Marseille-Q4993]